MKITIPIDKRALNLKNVKISAEQIERVIQERVAEALEHFNDQENGGWRLSKSFITSDILFEIFGYHIDDEINQAFINQDLSVSYQGGESFVELKEGYKPIYMHEKTGKLVLVENSDDKSYLLKYNSKNGYKHVGRL